MKKNLLNLLPRMSLTIKVVKFQSFDQIKTQTKIDIFEVKFQTFDNRGRYPSRVGNKI